MHVLTQVTVSDRNMTVVSQRAIQTAFLRKATAIDRDWRTELKEFLSTPRTQDQTCPGDLTGRECTILQLLSHGLSNKETAKTLGISPETVKSHVKNIFLKLKVERRAQAVSRGLWLGFITPIGA